MGFQLVSSNCTLRNWLPSYRLTTNDSPTIPPAAQAQPSHPRTSIIPSSLPSLNSSVGGLRLGDQLKTSILLGIVGCVIGHGVGRGIGGGGGATFARDEEEEAAFHFGLVSGSFGVLLGLFGG